MKGLRARTGEAKVNLQRSQSPVAHEPPTKQPAAAEKERKGKAAPSEIQRVGFDLTL